MNTQRTEARAKFEALLFAVGRKGDKSCDIPGIGTVRVVANEHCVPGHTSFFRNAYVNGQVTSLAKVGRLCDAAQ